MTFEVGDVVRLNSGGPEMTADLVEGLRVTCAWGRRRAAFDRRVLTLVRRADRTN